MIVTPFAQVSRRRPSVLKTHYCRRHKKCLNSKCFILDADISTLVKAEILWHGFYASCCTKTNSDTAYGATQRGASQSNPKLVYLRATTW